jgi:hypothetical protein
MTAKKNLFMSPAVSDLGLGDQVKQQMEDDDEVRRKKKIMAAANGNPGQYGDLTGSPATAMLYGKALI